MNCHEYIYSFLSAHADGQLSGPEQNLADEHLGHCPRCRARWAEECALKASVRSHVVIVKTPADVKLRIRAALGEAAERAPRHAGILSRSAISLRSHTARPPMMTMRPAASNAGDETAYRRGTAGRWLALQMKRAQYGAPIAFVVVLLVAATALFRAGFGNLSGQAGSDYQRSVPAFDFAIARFNQLSSGFAPNVPPEAFSGDDGANFAWVEETDPLHHVSAELPDISVSYEKIQMLPEFCDFTLAGYNLVGGRIDHLGNGQPVTYTLYRNQDESILSIGLKKRVSAPEGGYWFGTHALYSYRGYSICLTIYPVGHFASIIVARTPMVELMRNVVASDVVTWDR